MSARSAPRMRSSGAPRFAPRGLIFDLDGTLLDAFADIATALNATRARWGLPALPLEAVRREVGRGSAYLVRALVPAPEDAAEAALAFYLARYQEAALNSTRLMPGALAVLDRFAERPLAVVTNKPARHTRAILEGLGVWERFRVVLGGDSLPHAKPHPLPILHVLACFALPPEQVALVGDSVHDVVAGRAAGVHTVAVTTGMQTRAELAAEQPDALIAGLDELLHLFD